MCRLEGCRKPARLSGKKPSKFCSDEHGKQFMRRALPGGISSGLAKDKSRRMKNRADNSANGGDSPTAKRRRKSGEDDDYVDNPMDEDEEDDDDEETTPRIRGGKLDSRELKAVVSGVSSVEEFRKLGDAFMSPPATVSPEDDLAMKTKLPLGTEPNFTPAEDEQMRKLEGKKEQLARKREALKDKEKLFTLIRQRGKAVLEKMQKSEPKLKDICGFDSRLSWSEVEFEAWRSSSQGRAALSSGILLAPTKTDEDAEERGSDVEMKEVSGNDGEGEDESIRGVCQKKRCERHKQWIKLQQQEIRFEEDRMRRENGEIEREIKGVRERAQLRTLQET